ncbi:MAG: 4Fe-4S binding protein [Anaerolineaceae bacterium]|nr:4Fe-4S binding protein [Anaerolineaceae bacterium]
MSRPLWFVEILKHYFTDRFKIARWTKDSKLIRKVVDFLLFEGDQIFYLTKDDVIQDIMEKRGKEVNGFLVPQMNDVGVCDFPGEQKDPTNASVSEVIKIEVREDVAQSPSVSLPSTIIRQFIDEAKHVWLMEKCLCRDAAQCKDYPIGLGCIFMGEAVLGINPKLGHLATKEEAYMRLDLAQESGLIHLIGKNKIDTQWMGVHPGDRLLTVCNCCPCCCLYKVLPDLDDSISKKIEKMTGIEIRVNRETCNGCGKCADEMVCMTGNISIVDGKAIMGDHCIGCGRCYEVCPTGAIEMEITDNSFIEETMRRLREKVDVT